MINQSLFVAYKSCPYRLALGLLEWAKTATEEGYYACDMILGNFGQGEDGIIKVYAGTCTTLD